MTKKTVLRMILRLPNPERFPSIPGPKAPTMHRLFFILCAFLFHCQILAQIDPPKTAFEEYLIAPVHVHRLVTPGELNLSTTLTPKDIERIFGKVNKIWGHAGIHFPAQTLTQEPAANPNAYRQNYRSRRLGWMLALRPKETRSPDQFHVYYLKRFLANGVYIGRDGMFVKDTANLRTVKNGVDEPIPRVTSHELGHALTLKHRQEVTNLMASGTSGWTFNEAEIKQARDAARKFKWIRPATAILAEADRLFEKGAKEEAAPLYQLLATIPLHCPETLRARQRSQPAAPAH